jgi:hypothetical protein
MHEIVMIILSYHAFARRLATPLSGHSSGIRCGL